MRTEYFSLELSVHFKSRLLSFTSVKLIWKRTYWLCQITLTPRQPFRCCNYCRRTRALTCATCAVPSSVAALWIHADVGKYQHRWRAAGCELRRGAPHSSLRQQVITSWPAEAPVELGKIFWAPNWCLARALRQKPYF